MTVSAGHVNLNGTGVLTDGTLVNAGGINAIGEVNALHNVDATNTGTIEVRLRAALTLDSTTFDSEDGASRSKAADARRCHHRPGLQH